VILGLGEGRSYPMGRIGAVFKADGAETESRYSISEWWLEPHTQGPGAHSHPEDDIFYVIEGTMSVWSQTGGSPRPRDRSSSSPVERRTISRIEAAVAQAC
jgi:mannose-6-phosphate isomerase-like protein (cupin superfamily)